MQGEYKVETHRQSHTPGSNEAPCQMDSSWKAQEIPYSCKVVFIVSRLHVHKPILNHHSGLSIGHLEKQRLFAGKYNQILNVSSRPLIYILSPTCLYHLLLLYEIIIQCD